MKKIFLFVLSLSLFMACKNDPPASSTADTTATTTSPEAQVENVAAGKANAVAQYKRLNDLITEIDAMPADFRNKPEVQAIRNEMGDISGKAEIIMRSIDPSVAKTATSPEAVSTSADASAVSVEDGIAGMRRYAESIGAARSKFDQMAAGYKK